MLMRQYALTFGLTPVQYHLQIESCPCGQTKHIQLRTVLAFFSNIECHAETWVAALVLEGMATLLAFSVLDYATPVEIDVLWGKCFSRMFLPHNPNQFCDLLGPGEAAQTVR